MKQILKVILIAASSVTAVWAADWKPIEGSYAVTAKDAVDPAESDPKDSHVRFELEGDAARDLYRAMKVVEKPDECTGATSKTIGEMQCLFYKNEKKYSCNFSVNIAEQKIEYGSVC